MIRSKYTAQHYIAQWKQESSGSWKNYRSSQRVYRTSGESQRLFSNSRLRVCSIHYIDHRIDYRPAEAQPSSSHYFVYFIFFSPFLPLCLIHLSINDTSVFVSCTRKSTAKPYRIRRGGRSPLPFPCPSPPGRLGLLSKPTKADLSRFRKMDRRRCEPSRSPAAPAQPRGTAAPVTLLLFAQQQLFHLDLSYWSR